MSVSAGAKLILATLLFPVFAFAQNPGGTIVGDTAPGLAVNKNYMQKNPDAEKGVLGWSRYVDSGSRPTDGTGGSPTSDWQFTRTTTDPISGTGSFLVTKTATNTQGAGVSIPFTIDRGDRGNALQLNFDAELVSGSYSSGTEGSSPTDSDLIFYVYDVTNAALIEPSPFKLQVGVAGVSVQHQPLQFTAATNSTSYRLIIHTATTSASAYSVKLDNFKLAKPSISAMSSGLPMLAGHVRYAGSAGCDWNHSTGPWADFPADTDCSTPTITTVNGMVTAAPTKIPGFRLNHKRGKYMVIASLTSLRDVNGTYDNYLRLSDGSQSSGNTLLYYGTSFISYEPYTITGFFNYSGDGDVDIRVQGGHNPNPNSASVRILADAATLRDLEFTILYYPDVSESLATVTQISQKVEASYNTAAGQSIPHATDTIINFGTLVKDTHSAVQMGVNWRFTAPLQGSYMACPTILFDLATWDENDVTMTSIFKNGTYYKAVSYEQMRAAGTPQVGSFRGNCTVVDMLAGDYFDIRATQDSGSAKTLFPGAGYNYIDIYRISPGNIEPISVQQKVGFKATHTSGQSIPTASDTLLIFNDELEDPLSAYNNATGVFTAPLSGSYACICRFVFASYNPGTSSLVGYLFKNGVMEARTAFLTTVPVSNNWGPYPLPAHVRMNIGDTLDCRAFQNSGSSRAISAVPQDNEFSCTKTRD